MGTVKLVDVAKRAGVSVGTASRVLNGAENVAEHRRNRVLQAIDELGYKRNALAGSLKSNRSNTIGMIIPDISNQFYSKIVQGAMEQAKRSGYSVIVANTMGGKVAEYESVKLLSEKQVDGLVFMTYDLTDDIVALLNESAIPVAFIASTLEKKFPLFFSVNIDNEKAAFEGVSYLTECGHHNIAMIIADMDDYEGVDCRRAGYCRALTQKNIAIRPELIQMAENYSYESGKRAMDEILNKTREISAVFAISDHLALGAIRSIHDHCLSVPNDIAVLGFDDVDIASYAHPRISTIRQPRLEMGEKAVERLVQMIGDEAESDENIYLMYELIIRESTKK